MESNTPGMATALLAVLCFFDCLEIHEELITLHLSWALTPSPPLGQPSHPASPEPAPSAAEAATAENMASANGSVADKVSPEEELQRVSQAPKYTCRKVTM